MILTKKMYKKCKGKTIRMKINHFNISIIKSILRIVGSIVTIILSMVDVKFAIISLGAFYVMAELLGILEEVFDKRKEK